MDEYIEKAFKRNKEIQGDMLKGPVEVSHLDGSRWFLENAYFEEDERMLYVYSEHHHPMVFFRDDLESWGYCKRDGKKIVPVGFSRYEKNFMKVISNQLRRENFYQLLLQVSQGQMTEDEIAVLIEKNADMYSISINDSLDDEADLPVIIEIAAKIYKMTQEIGMEKDAISMTDMAELFSLKDDIFSDENLRKAGF